VLDHPLRSIDKCKLCRLTFAKCTPCDRFLPAVWQRANVAVAQKFLIGHTTLLADIVASCSGKSGQEMSGSIDEEIINTAVGVFKRLQVGCRPAHTVVQRLLQHNGAMCARGCVCACTSFAFQ